jgi:hypothetical protein
MVLWESLARAKQYDGLICDAANAGWFSSLTARMK